MAYGYNLCPRCGKKLAHTMLGHPWCPTCVGKEMGAKVAKRLKLNLHLGKKEGD